MSEPRSRMATKTPFPWFGGKRHAATAVWRALGDTPATRPPHYIEPFAGGLGVLLNSPHDPDAAYYSSTLNDIDGMVVNFWRSVAMAPDATAEAASWPVTELDKHARSVALLRWRETEMPNLLAGDPTAHDPAMAGWWAWAVCVQIGAWGTGGPWWPDDTGRLRKWKRGTLPQLDSEPAPGIRAGPPRVGNGGKGVNAPQLRQAPGIWAQLPHVSDNGKGVNHANLRQAPDAEPLDVVTMPELRAWFTWLQWRLRHVRVLHGDWQRAVTTGAVWTLGVRQGKGPAAVFLDPPYGDVGRSDVYGKHESLTVAEDVRAWCLTNGDHPKWRIVYAGYDEEGADLEAAGWQVVEWYTSGHLRGGMGNVSKDGHQQHRERLWTSPHCLTPDDDAQGALWQDEAH